MHLPGMETTTKILFILAFQTKMPKSLRLKEISVTAIFNSPKDAYSALVLFTSQQQIRIDD